LCVCQKKRSTNLAFSPASHLIGGVRRAPFHIFLVRPCHHIPGAKANDKAIEQTDDNHPRIEEAFRKYFYRETWTPVPRSREREKDGSDDGAAASNEVGGSSESNIHNITSGDDGGPTPANEEEKHEFEIIVCHANVIRYFLCRYVSIVDAVRVFVFAFV